MYKLLCITLFLTTAYSKAQDSLGKTRLSIYDCILYLGPVNYIHTHVTTSYIERFTENKAITDKSREYAATYENQSSSGFDFGLAASFRIQNAKHKILNRVKPRLYVHGSELSFFNYYATSQSRFVKDTLYYTDPAVPPLLIDSVSSTSINYSYRSQQVFMELGACVDIFTLPYFNFYAGFLYGQGWSTRNTFTVYRSETSNISPYPGQSSGTQEYSATRTIYTMAPSSISRFSIPIGVQHRFSKRFRFSPGIFTEIRPGIELYRSQSGLRLSQKMLAINAGLRLSFCRHT